MLGLGLEVCLRGFDVFTQYVVRIETLIRGFSLEGFCPEGILSEGFIFGEDFVLDSSHSCTFLDVLGCRLLNHKYDRQSDVTII